MKKEDTRGLSTVVATLLIILLVIVAVAILWGVIRSVITKNAESISLGKFTIDLEIMGVYPSNGTSDTGIKVRRNAGEGELEGIIFSIFDGEKTHIYEKHNVSLEQLEMKTFFVDYNGKIVSVSVYPILLGASGNTLTGEASDTYYYTGGYDGGGNDGGYDGGYISPGCIPNCAGKTACQNNRCGGNCGLECSGSTPHCINGICEADTGGLEPDCSCSLTICNGTTCDDGLGGNCFGTIQPNCGSQMCGEAPNGCGGDEACGKCDTNYHCVSGACIPNCDHAANCLGKECGDDGCGGTCPPGDCEYNHGVGYSCNESGLCEFCDAAANCLGKECGDDGCGGTCPPDNCNISIGETCNESSRMCIECTPDCDGKQCGDNSCGGFCEDTCNKTIGEYCDNETGYCISPEKMLDNGTVYSIWPEEAGIYFDSKNFSTSIDNEGKYNNDWVKFPGSLEFDCLLIDKFVTPPVPGIYNRSYIKFYTSSTSIKKDDYYEIWKTHDGCCKNYYCE